MKAGFMVGSQLILVYPISQDGRRVLTQTYIGAVIQASHSLSGEVALSELVKSLMKVALENAGAQRCVLALLRGAEIWIEAEAITVSDAIEVSLRQSIVTPVDLPISLLQTVIRTQESVVLDHARDNRAFARDEYSHRHDLQSAICIPLIKQSQLLGLLYLENRLTPGVFTPERSEFLGILASQAAISIENARLYARLVQENRERERAEDALRNAQAELAHVARLTTMGELVASIVHEISQPTNAVEAGAGAALHWLDREEPDIAEAREMLHRILEDCARARDVIHGLRALAKKAFPVLATFDINDAIREVFSMTKAQLEEHHVDLDDSGVEGRRLVCGDRVQLQQVMLNLIMNAVEAMAGVTARRRLITVSSRGTEADSVVVTVEDTGDGLDPVVATRIFEPFVTTKKGGMGMGLSICRSIIEAHEGKLTVSPREGNGTCVQFTVPSSAGSRSCAA